MSSEILLTDLPNEVLGPIMKELDYISIQKLRKVCRHLRNFLDNDYILEPPTFYVNVKLIVHSESVFFYYSLNENGDTGLSYYGKRGEVAQNTEVEAQNPVQILENGEKTLPNKTDYLMHFFVDFEIFNSFYGRKVDSMIVEFEEGPNPSFLEKFKDLDPIETDDLSINVVQEDQLALLSRFTAKNLTFFSSSLDGIVNFNEISKLKMWKSAEKVKIFSFTIDVPPRRLAHFRRVELRVKSMSSMDVLMLKQEFLKNPRTEVFDIYFDEMQFGDQFGFYFGRPEVSLLALDVQDWYFRTAHPQATLIITITHDQMRMVRLATSSLPPDVFIYEH